MADLGDKRFVNRVLIDLCMKTLLLSYQCFSLKQDTQSWMIVHIRTKEIIRKSIILILITFFFLQRRTELYGVTDSNKKIGS